MIDAIHISSFDFDGCILPTNLDLSIHQTLFDALKEQNKAFKVNIGMIGSNRQDKKTDDLNRNNREQDASAFYTLPSVFQDCGIGFDPVLLADVYGNQEHGKAFNNAAQSDDVYQANYVFDELKSSLLYFQIHQAALNARGCDFIILDKALADWKTLNKRSNAAYVYCKGEKKLFYINTMEDKVEECSNLDVSHLINLSEEDPKILQKRDCFEREDIFGFSLSEEELKTLGHQSINYPIYFDFYDDRLDIIEHLKNLFQSNPKLLPANVVLRLYHYDVSKQHTTRYFIEMNTQIIDSEGHINSNPGNTLKLLVKDLKRDDALAVTNAILDVKMQGRMLENHTIAVSKTEVNAHYGMIQDCSPKKVINQLEAFKHYLSLSFQTEWAFFDKNKQYSDKEQREAIEQLIKCLGHQKNAHLSAHLKPVLEHGRLGRLLSELNVKIEQSWVIQEEKPLRKALVDYKLERQQRGVLDYLFPIFGGHAKYTKFAAVDAILIATAGNDSKTVELDDTHQEVLTEGRLAKTLKENQVELSFVNDRKHALACLSWSLIDSSHRIKKITKINGIIHSTDLTDEARAAGLVVAFALSTKSWYSNGKAFGDTNSMHQFCMNLLKPNMFSNKLRLAVFNLAGLSKEESSTMQGLAREPLGFLDSLWDSQARCQASENLRQKLITNMQVIVDKASPVLSLTQQVNQQTDYNDVLGTQLEFR